MLKIPAFGKALIVSRTMQYSFASKHDIKKNHFDQKGIPKFLVTEC